jgi:hypothetical protein
VPFDINSIYFYKINQVKIIPIIQMKKKTKVIFKGSSEPKVGSLGQTRLFVRLLNCFENIVFGITKIGSRQIQPIKLFEEPESDLK